MRISYHHTRLIRHRAPYTLDRTQARLTVYRLRAGRCHLTLPAPKQHSSCHLSLQIQITGVCIPGNAILFATMTPQIEVTNHVQTFARIYPRESYLWPLPPTTASSGSTRTTRTTILVAVARQTERPSQILRYLAMNLRSAYSIYVVQTL